MLTPRMALTLGDWLYDSHGIWLRLRRGRLPVVDRLEVALPAGVKLEVGPGDPAALDLDGGEGEERVFQGEIHSIRRTSRGVWVTATNGAARLARLRPAMIVEKSSVGDVIEQICGDADVDQGTIDAGPTLALYGADGRCTGLQEIARLAGLMGCHAAFDGEGRLHVAPVGPGEDLALRYGREVLDMEAGEHWPDPAALAVIGEGVGGPSGATSRQIAADFDQGQSPAAGRDARRCAEPALRTGADASAAAEAWVERRAAAETPVKLRTWLLPRVAPGARIEVQDLPPHLTTDALRVSQVVHEISPSFGACSTIWGTARVDGGGLLGALGGLL